MGKVSEEGQDPSGAVEPMMIYMPIKKEVSVHPVR